MGVYLPKPKTDKESDNGGVSDTSRFGLTEMQGWRQYMEDAHLAVTQNELDVGLFGVFDGHGGPAVSKWVSNNFNSVFCEQLKTLRKECPAEHETVLVGRSLQNTFLQLDVKMQSKESRDELLDIHNAIEEKRTRAQREESAENGGAQAPANFLQALLSGQGGTKPMLRIVEQDGQKFVQLVPNEDGSDGPDGNDMDISGPAEITEITEDSPIPDIVDEKPMEPEEEVSTPKEEPVVADPEPEAAKEEIPEAAKEEMEIETVDVEPVKPEPSTDDTPSPPYLTSPGEEDEEATAEEPGDSFLASEPYQPECCGSTAVVTAVIGGENPYLVIANAGDSRAVLCRNGYAIPLSEDHKPQLPGESTRIRNAGGTVVNGRVDGNLNLSRSLGDLFYKKDKDLGAEAQKITAFPDIRITPITEQDEFVVLACDGIWDCMENSQVVDFVRNRLRLAAVEGTPAKLSEICETICDDCVAANPLESEGIGCDNMTIMIVELGPHLRKQALKDAEVQLMPNENEVSETR